MVIAFVILLAIGFTALFFRGKHRSAAYILYVVVVSLALMLLLVAYIYVNIHVLGNY